MIQDLLIPVVTAEHLGGLRLNLRFEDGTAGEIDLCRVVSKFRGLLQALQDPHYVGRVTVSDHGTLTWPNGVELDPIVVYCAATGRPLPILPASGRRAVGSKRGRDEHAPRAAKQQTTKTSPGIGKTAGGRARRASGR